MRVQFRTSVDNRGASHPAPDQRVRRQAAEEHELTEDRLEGVPVVLAKIRNGLEVGSQATQQPDHFQIAGGLRLEPPAGAHPIDVSINVELKQIGRIVTRSAGVFRLNATVFEILATLFDHK